MVFQFLKSDLQTVLIILFWVDLTVLCLLATYVFQVKDETNRGVIRRFTIARILQTAAWASFIVSNPDPGLKTMLGGTTGIFVGLYIETRTLFYFTKKPGLLKRTIVDALALFGILLLPVSFLLYGVNEERMIFLGLFTFLAILLPGPLSMLRRGKSHLQIAIGIGYGLLIIALVLGAAQMSFPSFPKFIPPPLIGDVVKILFVVMTMLGGLGIMLLTKQEADQRIAELAFRDPLTGLHNRRFFMEEARDVLRDAAREKRGVAMIFLDIDHFKRINDTYGHHFGDMVLRDFSAVLRLNLRPLDHSCRYGGEEFLLLLSDMCRESVGPMINRLLEMARASRFKLHPGFSYTISAGIVVGIPASGSVDDLQSLIDRADSALYRAKNAGRDRIEFYEHAPEP